MKFKLWFLLVFAFSSCDDFFVRDITGDSVVLISPSNGTTTVLFTQEFSWEKLRGAEKYRLQIAYPSFSNTQYYELDTMTLSNTFFYTLSPGTYEWRVRGENSSGNSQYSTPFTITVDTTSLLTNQTIILSSPDNASYSNDTTLSFSWQAMSIATSYSIIIKSGSSWSTGTILFNDTVATNSYSITLPQYLNEGAYTWGVRAHNAISYTQNYSTRSFGIDLTNPPVVTLSSPSHSSTLSTGSVSFSWTRATDTGTNPSPRTDSVFLYSDTTLTNLIYKDAFSTPGFARTLTSVGMYKWYIISYDAAGNASADSQKFVFTLQ